MEAITSAAQMRSAQQTEMQTAQQNAPASDTEFATVLERAFSGATEGATEDMDSIFEEAAALFGLPVNLLKAVAKAESGFNAGAVSGAGAIGVMQLMPQTARGLGVSNPFDARQNIMGGAQYLKKNLDQFGDISLALAAYNAGPGNVQKYGGIPPFAETQNYVKKVTSYMDGGNLTAGRSISVADTTGSVLSQMAQLSMMNAASGIGKMASGDDAEDGNSSMLGALSGYGGTGSYGGLDALTGTGGYGGLSALSGLGDYGGLNALSTMSGYGGTDALSGFGGYGDLAAAAYGGSGAMDQETFSSLVQLMRLRIMMDADEQAGFLDL